MNEIENACAQNLLSNLLFKNKDEKCEKIIKKITSNQYIFEKISFLAIKNDVFYNMIDNIQNEKIEISSIDNFKKYELIFFKLKQIKEQILNEIIIIQQIFMKNNITILDIKSINKYPDKGRDYDIYVGDNLLKSLNMLKKYGDISYSSSFSRLLNWPEIVILKKIRLDLYSSLTHFNEDFGIDESYIFQKMVTKNIGGVNLNSVSPEYSIIIQCITSLYYQAYIDLKNINIINNSILEENFDLEFFEFLINKSYITKGIIYYLFICNSILQNRDLDVILNKFTINNNSFLKFLNQQSIKKFPHKVPLKIIISFYIDAIFLSFKNRKYYNCIRICIPFLASFKSKYFIEYKINKKTTRIFNELFV